MKKIILLLIIFSSLHKSASADRIYIMNSPGYNQCETQLVAAIASLGHTITNNTTTYTTFPAGLTSTCVDPVNGYDWLCFFGNTDFSPFNAQIKAFIDVGGKVFCQYEVTCCTTSSSSAAAIAAYCTGLPIAPNSNPYIAFNGGSPGWEAVAVSCCCTFTGAAYMGMDGLPLANQLQATATLGAGSPLISVCPNFGFVFTDADFTGAAHRGALVGDGDINLWYDGAEPFSNGGSTPVNMNIVNFFFPNTSSSCFLVQSGCHNSYPLNINSTSVTVHLGNDTTLCAGNSLLLNASTAGATYLWQDNSTNSTLNVTTSGSYWVQVSTSCGVGRDTINVTVNPALTMTAPAAITQCTGTTVTVPAFASNPAGATYTWTNNTTSIGLAASGTGNIAGFTATNAGASPVSATITVTPTLGCAGTPITFTITINPLPAVTVNSPTICAGTTASLIANGATTYTWSAGAASTGVNTADATPPATTTYTVTGTALGCTNTAVSTVTVNNNIVVTVNSPTICAGQTVTLTAAGGAAYTWSAGATVTGITTADVTPAVTTTYTVTGTLLGCSGTAVATVTVSATLNVTVNSPTICAGQTATLTAAGGTTYTWSAGATVTGVNTADVTPATTTTYTVTGTSLTCTGTAVATVTVSNNITVTVNSPTICAGQTTTLTAAGAGTYTWSAGAVSTGVTTADVNPVTTSTYTVTGTFGGCSGTAVSTVTVNPLPVVTVNSPTLCAGQTATLTANGAVSYVWSAGASSTGVNTATATPAVTTSYTVTGSSVTCSNTAVSTVTVNPLPTALIGGGGTVCIGAAVPNVTITLTGTGPWNVTYSNAGGNTTIATPTSPYIISNPPAGTYSVISVSDANCTGTVSGSAIVNISPLPTPLFTVFPLSGCEPLCVNFTNQSSVAAGSVINSVWNFGDGGTANAPNPYYCYNQAGTYSVTLTVTSNNNCDATVTVPNMITVNPTPVANFTAPAVSGIFNSTVHFTDYSTNATAWNWNFGDYNSGADNLSNLQNPAHKYTQVGSYCVLLTAANGSCVDTSEICVQIEPEFTFYVPNSFSPNEDGKNDEFFGKGDNITSFQMWIYDRWGNSVFYTDNIDKHWDGTMNGSLVQMDVYVYVIKLKDFKKDDHSYIGNVTLEQ